MGKYVVFANILSFFTSSVAILILVDAPLIAFALVVSFDSFVLALGFIFYKAFNIDRRKCF